MEKLEIHIGTESKYSYLADCGKWVNPFDYLNKKDFINACKKIHSDEDNPSFIFNWVNMPNWAENVLIFENDIKDEFWSIMPYLTTEDDINSFGAYLELYGWNKKNLKRTFINYQNEYVKGMDKKSLIEQDDLSNDDFEDLYVEKRGYIFCKI